MLITFPKRWRFYTEDNVMVEEHQQPTGYPAMSWVPRRFIHFTAECRGRGYPLVSHPDVWLPMTLVEFNDAWQTAADMN